MMLSQVAEVLKVRDESQNDWEDKAIRQVSTDTRTLEPGDLYFALRGPNFDGHDFLKFAEEKGCAAVVVESVNHDLNIPQFVVKNVRLGLGQLAEAWRLQFADLKVVAVTGSCGKTTVKEMLASIFSQVGATLATEGNLNNDIGVPLTLFNLNDSHRFAVLELGANAMGEIAYTAHLAHPDISLITNAASAHVEGFGSEDNIAKEKAEVYRALADNGIAIVNGDDSHHHLWLNLLKSKKKKALVCSQKSHFGEENRQADYWLEKISQQKDGSYCFCICSKDQKIPVCQPLLGRHNVINAMLSAAIAMQLSVGCDAVQKGLEQVRAIKGRLILSSENRFGVQLIDDTYNASPYSVKAAIDLLANYPGETVLVLGNMAELGEASERHHFEAGKWAKKKGISFLLTTGENSQAAARGFGQNAYAFESQTKLIDSLPGYLKPGTTVLVKGSRSAKMENVVSSIQGRSD